MRKKTWISSFILGGAAIFAAIAVGGAIAMYKAPAPTPFDFSKADFPSVNAAEILDFAEKRVSDLSLQTKNLQASIDADAKRQADTVKTLEALAKKSKSNKNLTDEVYEKMIVDRLGQPIKKHNGTNSEILLFELKKEDFRGYMAKITLKTENALRVTLAPEDKKFGETTLAAAKRTDALFAINGGGFATSTVDGVKKLVPMGNTMIKGKLINEFIPTWNDISFAGFTKKGKLVGGKYETEEELLASGAWQGVSFVPALISDWEPLDIPSKWKNTKQPRTVMGQYPNGDLFFIVVDGRQSDWSNGITLEEMQILLMRLGVMEAFTLDGGGSSAMVYNDKLLNKPSDGNQRNVATNIVIMP